MNTQDAKDTPPQDCNLRFSRDCKKDAGCVISALSNQVSRMPLRWLPCSTDDSQTSLITNPDSATTTINEALKFIIHFIGDMHQPLHTEDLDRGGNGIPVSFDGHHAKNINLHEVWDTAILRKLNDLSQSATGKDEKAAAATWADKLADALESPPDLSDECTELADPDKCGILWATETNKLVCSYVLAPGVDWIEQNDLGGDYYTGAVPIVEQQVTKAGLRVAAWVNAIADQVDRAESLVKQDL